ncbi:MAG TPA: ATP-binding protein [Noviherbaspirillum sp.]|nr:ATP-binding protein [Noviherbaspirillum sp.]
MTKLNLMSIGIVVVMTVSVLSVGIWIINDILYKFSEQVLRLELENAGKTIFQELNRSGVRAAAAAAESMGRQLQMKPGLHTTKLAIIEATDNRIVYHPDFSPGDRAPFAFVGEMFQRERGVIEYTLDGISTYAVFVTVQPIDWLLSLSISKAEMLEGRGLFLREVGIITFVVLCMNAFLVSLFGWRLLKRIGATAHCVNRIEKGELSARIATIPVRDEIGILQEGVNAMCERIEQRTAEQQEAEKALREREARIRRLVDSNIIGIFLWDMQGNIVDANDAFLRLIGYDREELAAGEIFWTRLTPPEFVAADVQKGEEVRRTQTCTPYEKEFFRKDGTRVPILLGAAMFEGSGETGVAFVLDLTERRAAEAALRSAHDQLEIRVQERTSDLKRINQRLEFEIQERKQAEEGLAQRTHELARSNAELEQLAYVASHDLQEPLRMIASYLQLLEKRYAGKLDADGREFIDYAVDGARRMQSLIDDLLTFSRLGTKAQVMQPTDCSKVMALVLRGLYLAVQECGAQIHCDPLPVVMADQTQLAQLFQNLITNAIKFRSDASPMVRIAAEPTEEGWCFSVEDNGIGIAPEYRERIFVMFQRLHGRREYPGTGIGLAICKKIVERHGGRIWVESAPGQGTIFRFTLPRLPDDTQHDRLAEEAGSRA